MAFLAAFALPLCRAWLGERPDLAVLPLIMLLSAASAHLHIVTGPASAVFRSQGNVANEFACHWLRIVGIAAGVGLAAQCMGLTVDTVARGLAGGVATAAVAYVVHSYRALRIPLPLLATRVPLPGLVAAASAAGRDDGVVGPRTIVCHKFSFPPHSPARGAVQCSRTTDVRGKRKWRQ